LAVFIPKTDKFTSALAAGQDIWLFMPAVIPPCIAALIATENSFSAPGSLDKRFPAVFAHSNIRILHRKWFKATAAAD